MTPVRTLSIRLSAFFSYYKEGCMRAACENKDLVYIRSEANLARPARRALSLASSSKMIPSETEAAEMP